MSSLILSCASPIILPFTSPRLSSVTAELQGRFFRLDTGLKCLYLVHNLFIFFLIIEMQSELTSHFTDRSMTEGRPLCPMFNRSLR